MHSIMKVGDKKFVLTSTQLDAILDVLFDAPIIHTEFVGTGKGDEGTAYVKLLKRVVSEDGLNVDTMPDAYIAALEFKTKLHLENKSK